jgi:prophage regulatory protein
MDLVGVAEIATLLGVSKQRVDQLARQPDFPDPEAIITAGRIWRREAIEAWARATGRLPEK